MISAIWPSGIEKRKPPAAYAGSACSTWRRAATAPASVRTTVDGLAAAERERSALSRHPLIDGLRSNTISTGVPTRRPRTVMKKAECCSTHGRGCTRAEGEGSLFDPAPPKLRQPARDRRTRQCAADGTTSILYTAGISSTSHFTLRERVISPARRNGGGNRRFEDADRHCDGSNGSSKLRHTR